MTIRALLDFTGLREPLPGPGRSSPLRRLLSALAAGLVCLVLASQVRIQPAGGDALLYAGLADNLVAGRGYVDTVRGDEIIPPIGHPAVLAAAQTLGISADRLNYVFAFLGLALIFHAALLAGGSWMLATVLTMVFGICCHRSFTAGGIESSILFFNALLVWSLARAFRSRRRAAYAVSGLIATGVVLIRPTLLPAFAVFLAYVLVRIVRGRALPGSSILPFFAVLATGLISVAVASQLRYGDVRYLSGTYGSIPVYCAFNEYLDLRQPYFSTAWDDLPAEVRSRAVEPLIRKTGWKARDRALKGKIWDFVRDYPSKALAGILWRLKMYTFGNPNDSYRAFWYLSCLSFLALVLGRYADPFRFTFPAVLFFLFGLSIIAMKSLFVFTDNRYTIDLMPYLFYPVIQMASYVLMKYRGPVRDGPGTPSG